VNTFCLANIGIKMTTAIEPPYRSSIVEESALINGIDKGRGKYYYSISSLL